TPGTRIASIKVHEGSGVEANAELFRLDTYEILDASCHSYEAQLEEARELLAVEKEHSVQLEKELALEKEQAEKLNPLDIEAQTEKLKALNLKLEHEEAEARRLQGLHEAKSSFVSEQQRNAQALLVDAARAERNGARALLEKLTKGHALAMDK